ncbi:flagellar hook-associated protein 3 FlgL [Desulfonispora thiosulfatigenes DSM 11270]|uniref:Flagellar hook-associated protein 3 FlgL n=1 Tax=Desulfonispora thiosulfatigenes DSM 11270 TaxID=656914 RepID=A0A1W1UNX8_DESTI|nr:flagellar hook-associated protein FlgL [Desulfonispora thiosulfatigenes]SMB82812.1 flagellar hook-associated protein 3 FlgL [Desulfonispora thiosulfatigenes DSM 11270]
MRVTNKIMTNTTLNNINTNLTRLQKLNEQMSSGKNVSRPSDDPIAVARIMSFKTIQSNQEQYDRNMDDAIGWLDTTDGALMNVNKVIQRVRELDIYGANGVIPDESREAIAMEIDKLVEEMAQIGNVSYGGRYIFGGGHTTEAPFKVNKDGNGEVESVDFIKSDFDKNKLNDTYKLEYEVEAGVNMNVSVGKLTFHTGADGKPGLNSIFSEMINLRKNLQAGNGEEITKAVGTFDKLHDNLLSEIASVGAMSKRMESAKERSFNFQLDLKNTLGKIEDVDYAKKSIEFKSQQAIYEAALMTSAKAIQPSLIQFLK